MVAICAALELGIAVAPELGIAELRIVMTLELGIANCSVAPVHGTNHAVEMKRVLAKAMCVRPQRASIYWL